MKRQDNQWKVRGVLYGHLGLWEFISSELRASENVKVSDRHRSRWAAHHRPPLDSFYVFVLERIKSARRARRCLSSGRTRNRSSLSQGPPFDFFFVLKPEKRTGLLDRIFQRRNFFFLRNFLFCKVVNLIELKLMRVGCRWMNGLKVKLAPNYTWWSCYHCLVTWLFF